MGGGILSIGKELNKNLPKEAFFRNVAAAPAVKASIASEVKRFTLIQTISAQTCGLASGGDVSEIDVIEVELKGQELSANVLETIAKALPFKVVFRVVCGEREKFAAYHSRLFVSEWSAVGRVAPVPAGLSLDELWKNIVAQIGGFTIESGRTLDEQIALDDERRKLQKQIDTLEKQAWAEKQPKKKFELANALKKLTSLLKAKQNEG